MPRDIFKSRVILHEVKKEISHLDERTHVLSTSWSLAKQSVGEHLSTNNSHKTHMHINWSILTEAIIMIYCRMEVRLGFQITCQIILQSIYLAWEHRKSPPLWFQFVIYNMCCGMNQGIKPVDSVCQTDMIQALPPKSK